MTADSIANSQADELRRCRGEVVASAADYNHMRQTARVALASLMWPPLLLDSHTYKGMGAGALLAVLLKVFLFH